MAGYVVAGFGAEGDTIELREDVPLVDIHPYIGYFIDPDGLIDIATAINQTYSPLPENVIDFGFTPVKIWMRFRVSNATDESLARILRTSARFMRPLEVFRVDTDGTITPLLYNDETQRFGERPLPELRFIAIEIALQPAQQATIFVRFGAGGRAAMSLDIASREEALTEQYRAAVGVVMFGAILMTLSLVNLFHFFAVRKPAYLVYVFYESFNFVYTSHLEGFTFQYLWPNLPQWNDDATPIIAALGLIIGNFFAMTFLEIRKYSLSLYRIYLLFVGMAVLSLLATVMISSSVGNQLTALQLPLALLLSIVAAVVVLRRGHYLARYFLAAWSLLGVGAVIWSGAILGWFTVDYNVLTIFKSTIATQAIILSMGLADQVRRINNEYLKTQESLIENLQGRLDDARERLHLEKENEDAMAQLLEKSKRLATTSHDINQPIQSLRLAIRALGIRASDQEAVAQLERTLTHMESVLGESLDEASEEMRKGGEHSAVRSLVAGKLLSEVCDQFRRQAQEKQLDLRCFHSKSVIITREIPLRRCLMNLLSNAIQYTDSGSILVGVRHQGKRLIFQVFDTGGSLADENIDILTEPLIKGASSVGHGLGLTIVKETCDEYGWDFSVQSVQGKGSCFAISVPVRVRHD